MANIRSAPMRILLVEDDPTSRVFFEAALKPLDVLVESADCSGTALSLAQDRCHALWLFDAHLPDGTGIGLLARLRAQGLRTPAIAHTASSSTTEQAQLLAAGFEQVLIKPMPPATLRTKVRDALATYAPAATTEPIDGIAANTLPIWDDGAADLALNGNHQHVLQLRRMFLDDLARVRDRIAWGWQHDPLSAQAELHKLRAACGFVGAARLADAVEALQHMPDLADSLVRFKRALNETLHTGSEPSGSAQPGPESS